MDCSWANSRKSFAYATIFHGQFWEDKSGPAQALPALRQLVLGYYDYYEWMKWVEMVRPAISI